MLPALSILTSGSDSSRCGSVGTAAENASPCAGADGSDSSLERAVVVITSLPLYGWPVGATFKKPHASTLYVPGGRLLPTTVSVVLLPSLDPTSPLGPITV